MSNLSVAWTSSPGLTCLRASVMTFRFLFRSYAFLEVKNVKLRFPRSWKTVPPPLRLRAKGIPALLMAGKLHSDQGFWCRPMTTAGRFLHSSRMLRCCRSTLASIQSSRARFWYTSVDRDWRTSPALQLSELMNRPLELELVLAGWLPVWHPFKRDKVLLILDITMLKTASSPPHVGNICNVKIKTSAQSQLWLQKHYHQDYPHLITRWRNRKHC